MIVLLAQNVTKRGVYMGLSLKAARVNAGLSRPDVIKKLLEENGVKIAINTLASYENRATQPDVVTASALVSIYGLSVDDIAWV